MKSQIQSEYENIMSKLRFQLEESNIQKSKENIEKKRKALNKM